TRASVILDRIERRARGKWQKVHTYQFFGLMIIVAVPLPGTGAWTGALIAALMNMRFRNAIPAIFAGVVTAGFLVTGLTYGFTSIFH
ncbi:MAG: COG2426 family protein, partial [Oscillospiraceae bacterium]